MVQLGKASKSRRPEMGARRIYEELGDQIVRGVYRPGGLLPSSRGLAADFNVSRTTVTIAYEQLAAEGFIEVRQGARPRVSPAAIEQRRTAGPRPLPAAHLSSYGDRLRATRRPPQEARRGLIVDFRYGDLAPSDFPLPAWKRAVVAAITQRPDRLAYEDPRGSRRLREALQAYLWRARTLRCDPEQIIIVNGSQQGLDLCARLLLDPGDRFVIENPCYAMARSIFSATGAMPASIAVDEGGLKTDLLGGIDARLAFVTPSHQFPLGGILPIGRRRQLLTWARQAKAFIVEDDYDSEYRYDISPVPPLHGLDESGNVIYLGTVSKTLSPTLRIGYLVVPPQLQDVFTTAKQLVDRHTSISEQSAVASMLESGLYESHVRKIRRRNSERRQALLNAIRRGFGDRISIAGADAGLHIVIWCREIPQSMTAELIEQAGALGVGVHSVTPLYDPCVRDDLPDQVGLIMGYAALDTRQIEKGVQLLRQAVDRLRA